MNLLAATAKTEAPEFICGNGLLFLGGYITSFVEWQLLGIGLGVLGFFLDFRVFRKSIDDRRLYQKDLDMARENIKEAIADIDKLAKSTLEHGLDSFGPFRSLEELVESLKERIKRLEDKVGISRGFHPYRADDY